MLQAGGPLASSAGILIFESHPIPSGYTLIGRSGAFLVSPSEREMKSTNRARVAACMNAERD